MTMCINSLWILFSQFIGNKRKKTMSLLYGLFNPLTHRWRSTWACRPCKPSALARWGAGCTPHYSSPLCTHTQGHQLSRGHIGKYNSCRWSQALAVIVFSDLHLILQIVLVQNSLFLKSSSWKIERNWINSVPKKAATTFALSSVYKSFFYGQCEWVSFVG